MKQTEDMRVLMQRFLEAETTVEEERRLYAFFLNGEIPADLLPYRDMMLDFGAWAPEEKTAAGKRPLRIHLSAWGRRMARVAAVLALGVAGWWGIRAYEAEQLNRQYGGSYMIVNGERIDNLRQIRSHIEQTLLSVEHFETLASTMLSADEMEQNLMEQITDPDVRREIAAMLND